MRRFIPFIAAAFIATACGPLPKSNETGAGGKKDVEILQTSHTYESFMKAYTIHCRVKNNTSKLIQYIDLQATFYDKNKKIVGTGLGNAMNIPAGEERTIDVMGMEIPKKATYEVQVENVMY